MGDVFLTEISDQHRTIRGIGQIHRTEGEVIAAQRKSGIRGGESRPFRQALGSYDVVVQRIRAEDPSPPPLRQGGALGHQGQVAEPGHWMGAPHHGHFPESIGIGGRAKFARILSLFQVDALLHMMPAPGIAAVVPAEEAAFAIEGDPKGVATALCENFIPPPLGVITPDHAPFHKNRRSIFLTNSWLGDPAGGRAALSPVDPAIRSPGEAIGHAMGILQAKSLKPYLWGPIRHIIHVGVRIK